MLSLEFIVSTHRFKHAGDLKASISISDGSSIRTHCHNKLNSSKTTKIKWLLRFQLSIDNVLSRSENTKENISCKQKHFSLKKYLGLSVRVQGGGTNRAFFVLHELPDGAHLLNLYFISITTACDPLKKMKETYNSIWWYMFNESIYSRKNMFMSDLRGINVKLTAGCNPSSFSAIKISYYIYFLLKDKAI